MSAKSLPNRGAIAAAPDYTRSDGRCRPSFALGRNTRRDLAQRSAEGPAKLWSIPPGQPGKSNDPSELRTDKTSGVRSHARRRGRSDLRNVYSLDVFVLLKKVSLAKVKYGLLSSNLQMP
jgi:hypothetical protein